MQKFLGRVAIIKRGRPTGVLAVWPVGWLRSMRCNAHSAHVCCIVLNN